MDHFKEKINVGQEYLKKIGNYCYKYRYLLATILLILCVIFELSGSSIGMWKKFGMSDVENEGILFGQSREIRSDEWAVLTPMMFSQKFNKFQYFSNLIRGGIRTYL